MIRKAIIVVALMAASSTALAWGMTALWSVHVKLRPSEKEVISICFRHGIADAYAHVTTSPTGRFASLPLVPNAINRVEIGPNVVLGSNEFPALKHGFNRIRYQRIDLNPWTYIVFVSFPLWILPLLFAAHPAIAFMRGPFRRYRRRKKGLCIKCGYDLTGNVSGVCPECGERI